MPEFVADLHTHTLVCGHAFSTVTENIRAAADCGLAAIALTEHGPAFPGSVGPMYFGALRNIPDELFGVRVLKGCEANFIDFSGRLDLNQSILSRLDIVVAGCHSEATPCGTVEENTRMYLGAISNPELDIVCHMGYPKYPVDIEKVVKAAAAHDVALEINNSSWRSRPGSEENCEEVVRLAKQFGAKLSVGTDAHYHVLIGKFDRAYELITRFDFPLERVINHSMSALYAHLKRRR